MMNYPVEVVVQFDYTAQEVDELTIKKGDIIKNVMPKEDGWYEGVLNNRKGVFPDNFVTVLTVSKPKEGSKIDIKHKVKWRCEALFSYEPENNDEISLHVGDILDVLEEAEEGWWRGIKGDKVGLFPSNFVAVIESDKTARIEDGQTPKIEDKTVLDGAKLSAEKKPDPKVGLKSTGNVLPKQQSPPTVPPGPSPSEAPSLPPKPIKEMAEALFHYAPQNEDELELREGDIVTVLSKEIEDKGWWRGELNGKVGVFPDNFVQLLPHDEKGLTSKPPPVLPAKPGLNPKSEDNKGPNKALRPSIDKAKKTTASSASEVRQPIVNSLTKPQVNGGVNGECMKAKVNHSGELDLDSVNRGSSKLNHITAQRVRAPKRRPPSNFPPRESEVVDNGLQLNGPCDANETPGCLPPLPPSEKPTRPLSFMDELRANQMRRQLQNGVDRNGEDKPVSNGGEMKLSRKVLGPRVLPPHALEGSVKLNRKSEPSVCARPSVPPNKPRSTSSANLFTNTRAPVSEVVNHAPVKPMRSPSNPNQTLAASLAAQSSVSSTDKCCQQLYNTLTNEVTILKSTFTSQIAELQRQVSVLTNEIAEERQLRQKLAVECEKLNELVRQGGISV